MTLRDLPLCHGCLAELHPGDTLEQLIALGDERLYEAKQRRGDA